MIVNICRHDYWVVCQEVIVGIIVGEAILGQVFVVVKASREVAMLGQTCRWTDRLHQCLRAALVIEILGRRWVFILVCGLALLMIPRHYKSTSSYCLGRKKWNNGELTRVWRWAAILLMFPIFSVSSTTSVKYLIVYSDWLPCHTCISDLFLGNVTCNLVVWETRCDLYMRQKNCVLLTIKMTWDKIIMKPLIGIIAEWRDLLCKALLCCSFITWFWSPPMLFPNKFSVLLTLSVAGLSLLAVAIDDDRFFL